MRQTIFHDDFVVLLGALAKAEAFFMCMPGPYSPTIFYPPSQKTMDVSLWMNAQGGPFEARRAKEGASADCAEEMKDTTGVSPWRSSC